MSSGQNSSASSARPKLDPAWGHVTLGKNAEGKSTYTCSYCLKCVTGARINRMKQHLAQNKGQIAICRNVPADVKFQMEEALKAIDAAQKEKEQIYEHQNPYGTSHSQFEGDDNEDVGDDDVREITPTPQQNKRNFTQTSGAKRQRSGARKGKDVQVTDYFAPRTTLGSQPTIMCALQPREAI